MHFFFKVLGIIPLALICYKSELNTKILLLILQIVCLGIGVVLDEIKKNGKKP